MDSAKARCGKDPKYSTPRTKNGSNVTREPGSSWIRKQMPSRLRAFGRKSDQYRGAEFTFTPRSSAGPQGCLNHVLGTNGTQQKMFLRQRNHHLDITLWGLAGAVREHASKPQLRAVFATLRVQTSWYLLRHTRTEDGMGEVR